MLVWATAIESTAALAVQFLDVVSFLELGHWPNLSQESGGEKEQLYNI